MAINLLDEMKRRGLHPESPAVLLRSAANISHAAHLGTPAARPFALAYAGYIRRYKVAVAQLRGRH